MTPNPRSLTEKPDCIVIMCVGYVMVFLWLEFHTLLWSQYTKYKARSLMTNAVDKSNVKY